MAWSGTECGWRRGRPAEWTCPCASARPSCRSPRPPAASGTPFFYGLYTGGQSDRAIGIALEDVDNSGGLDGDQVVRVGIAALAVMAGTVRATFIGG
jgi:hypothetical protein